MVKISVVIAAKNESTHLTSAITSVLNQKDVLVELIFVDDNSSDDTLMIASNLALHHKNLIVLSNPNSGKCSAFNYGVSQSSGDFVCIFAGDDIMPADSLLARLKAVQMYAPQMPVVGLAKIKSFSEIKKFDGILVPRKKGKGSLSGVSPLMSQAAASMIFPVPEHLPNEDTWMELAVLYLPGIVLIHSDIVCCHWRVHSGNSINMFVGFNAYNKKITIRMSALGLFYERYSSVISDENNRKLLARVNCETARKSGSVTGILKSKASLLERLRALSMSNNFFYSLRSSGFKSFSGWGY